MTLLTMVLLVIFGKLQVTPRAVVANTLLRQPLIVCATYLPIYVMWWPTMNIQDIPSFFSSFVNDPFLISIFCISYILLYYFVSIFSVKAVKSGKPKAWRKNGRLDILTSITSIIFASFLIWSLSTLAFSATLTLSYLILYYFFFICLFAFWYGILEWHWKGMLEGVDRDSWKALLEHLLISVQTQTTIGYTRGRPKHLLVEVIACIQALLGIFLITISIARAVNQMR